MLATLTLAVLLAAPVADAPVRFDHTRTNEAQRAMLASFTTARELVSGTYNWASSSVTLDRYIAQQKALDISRHVRATEARWTQMVDGLSSAQADQVTHEVATIRDLFGQAQLSATKLSNEAGAASPTPTELRYLTSTLYGALALAHEHQIGIGKRLGLGSAEPTPNPVR